MWSIFYLVEERLASQGHSSMELIIQLVGWLFGCVVGWSVGLLAVLLVNLLGSWLVS
jgi:hypothetical protein